MQIKTIAKFHYITHDDVFDFSHQELVSLACKGGAKWIQLRVKNKTHNEWLKIAIEIKKICDTYNAKLIVNDNVSVTKKINSYGVHLGKTDVDAELARKILGKNFIIGGTANTANDIIRLNGCKVDYIGLGPFSYTSTKKNIDPILGINGIKKILEETKKINRLPIIVIGGIKVEDVANILDAGAYGVAVSSAINFAKNKSGEIHKFIDVIYQNSTINKNND